MISAQSLPSKNPQKRTIPYVNLAGQHAPLKQKLLDAVGRVLDHGQFILGPEVAEFERRLASLCGVKEVVAVNSGTDALVLSLKVLGIGPGDEVITAPNSFVGSASAIALTGATPTFADVDDGYNLDPMQLERALTSRTRAIMPVHLTGRPAEMAPIMAFARKHNLRVIEDCAQAVCAEYNGVPVGGIGDLGCFSLHPLKTLNACGDGGAITVNDPQLAAHLREMRNLGLRTRENCVEWSGNSRLDTMQAAMLLVKLDYLSEWTEKRRQNAQFYREALQHHPYIRVPDEPSHLTSVYHTFVVMVEQREALQSYLTEMGIGTAVHYPRPIHLQSCARELGIETGAFPVTEHHASRIMSIPIYPELTGDDLAYIAHHLWQFYRQ